MSASHIFMNNTKYDRIWCNQITAICQKTVYCTHQFQNTFRRRWLAILPLRLLRATMGLSNFRACPDHQTLNLPTQRCIYAGGILLSHEHTRLTMHICRPFQYHCTSRWPYESEFVALRSIVVSLRCVCYDGKVYIPLWFVHEDSHLMDETT